MKTGFRDLLTTIVPEWLSNRPGLNNGYKFLYTPSLILDAFTEAVLEGVDATFPLVGTPTALPLIGDTRQIQRGLGESDASYEIRLTQWLDLWRLAGRPWGMLLAMLGYVLPDSIEVETVDDTGNFFFYLAGATADTAHPPTYVINPAWNWDGASDPFAHQPFGQNGLWARMWVVLYPDPGLWARSTATFGGGNHFGDGLTLGWNGTASQANTLRVITSQWRAAHSIVPQIIISFDSTWFQNNSIPAKLPDGTWGHWGKVAASGGFPRVYVPSRASTAIYIDGVN